MTSPGAGPRRRTRSVLPSSGCARWWTTRPRSCTSSTPAAASCWRTSRSRPRSASTPKPLSGNRYTTCSARTRRSSSRTTTARSCTPPLAIEYQEVVPQEDGLHTYISIKAPLVDDTGRPYAVCGVSTDITERKRLEESLKQADRRKDAFITTVSHELRQPLAPMVTALELVKRRISEEATMHAHEVIERQVRRIGAVDRRPSRCVARFPGGGHSPGAHRAQRRHLTRRERRAAAGPRARTGSAGPRAGRSHLAGGRIPTGCNRCFRTSSTTPPSSRLLEAVSR